MENKPLTLTQLQTLIGNTLRYNRELQGVWVTCELSDVRIAGGHCYMELIEKDVLGNTTAKSRAMIWAGTLHGLRSKFYNATGKDISTGMKVMVRGSVGYHNLYGLSFTISDIDPHIPWGIWRDCVRKFLPGFKKKGL